MEQRGQYKTKQMLSSQKIQDPHLWTFSQKKNKMKGLKQGCDNRFSLKKKANKILFYRCFMK